MQNISLFSGTAGGFPCLEILWLCTFCDVTVRGTLQQSTDVDSDELLRQQQDCGKDEDEGVHTASSENGDCDLWDPCKDLI